MACGRCGLKSKKQPVAAPLVFDVAQMAESDTVVIGAMSNIIVRIDGSEFRLKAARTARVGKSVAQKIREAGAPIWILP